jgi:peptidoglycan/LPS O-acetylase OafA/YrhL
MLVADFYASGFAIDFFKKAWIAPFALVIFLVMFLMPRSEETHAMELLPLAILFPFMIGTLYYIIFHNETVKKIFSYKFIPIIGGMCYTTYLIHYTVISILGRYTIKVHLTDYYVPNLLLQFVLLIIPILLISSVFFLYIERPFMTHKLMDRIMGKDKHKETANMQSELPGN